MNGIDFRLVGRPASINNDLYDYEHRVDGIVDLLEDCNLPFVFSVEGEWGRGKSTLVNMILERISTRKHPSARRWEIVHYHPWRYDIQEFDDAWESLVEILHADLSGSRAWGKGAEELLELLIHNRWTRLVGKVGVSIGKFVPGGDALEHMSKGIEEFFKDSLTLGPRYMIFERIRKKIHQLLKQKRVLLVIDDLDRCSPIAVCNILRCIPTLFAQEKDGPSIAILLCLDRNATRDSLVTGQGLSLAQAENLLEKLIHVHVTLPILQIGRGDQAIAMSNIVAAITSSGHRRKSTIKFETKPPTPLEFEIHPDQIDIISKFMNYNPRKLERFCLLFDLKWKSRFQANSQVLLDKVSRGERHPNFQVWLNRFRNRLIWETIVELRWPSYDVKSSDLDANQEAIRHAIKGENPKSIGLPCEHFLADASFLEIHRIREEWSNKVIAD